MNNFPTKWLACRQNAFDRIRFIEYSNPEEMNVLPYYQFLEYIQNGLSVVNFQDFRSAIDHFKQIVIDLETGEWFEYEGESKAPVTFEELVNANKKAEEKTLVGGKKLVADIWEKGRARKSIVGMFQ